MISTRSLRDPSPTTAALLRLAAFLVAAASVVIIPVEIVAGAYGHETMSTALAVSAGAVLLTLGMTIAARSLDPMRR